MNEGKISLEQLRGQIVVLNFWARWCVSCRLEAPAFQQVWRNSEGELAFVGVAHKDIPHRARDFAKRYEVTYPNGLDVQGRIALSYGMTGVPETVIIGGEGIMRVHHVSPVSQAETLTSIIEKEFSTSP